MNPLRSSPIPRLAPRRVLHDGTVAARFLLLHRQPIEAFVAATDAHVELVPSLHGVYAFAGPPRHFEEFALVSNEGENRTLSPGRARWARRAGSKWERVRACYDRHLADERFETIVAGRWVTVIPCWPFGIELAAILAKRRGR